MRSWFFNLIFPTLIVAGLQSCAPPTPGPDKQFEGTATSAVTGAGAGAVTGFQFGAGLGPGAAIGAGLGAVVGAVEGSIKDDEEDHLMALAAGTRREREIAVAQEILVDHYKRRMELHPTRDIYPADLFFFGDEVKLKPEAAELVRQIARLNKRRLPWSRLVIAAYAKSRDDQAPFAKHLVEKRSRTLGDLFVRAGIEPRRIEAKGLVIDAPILIDPSDDPQRYAQAIEIIPLDR